MPWVKVGDDAATFPALMSVMGQNGADERILNEVAGFLFRLATLSGAHLTDYVVDAGTCFMIGGSRTQELIKFCVTAGLLEKTTAFGGNAVRIIENEDFINLRLKKDVEWDRQRVKDAREVRLIVPVRKRDGDQCRYCGVVVQWRGRSSNRTGTYDHRMPGEGATVKTMVVACLRCNSSRQDNPQWDDDNPLLPEPQEPLYSAYTVEWLANNGVKVEQNLGVKVPDVSSASEGSAQSQEAAQESVPTPTTVESGAKPAEPAEEALQVDPTAADHSVSGDPCNVEPSRDRARAEATPVSGREKASKMSKKRNKKSYSSPNKMSFVGSGSGRDLSGKEREGQEGSGVDGAARRSGRRRRRRKRTDHD